MRSLSIHNNTEEDAQDRKSLATAVVHKPKMGVGRGPLTYPLFIQTSGSLKKCNYLLARNLDGHDCDPRGRVIDGSLCAGETGQT